ncbi:NAD(P)/FAD-dependent oxidoreductase [Pseudarthrobacter sp. H2]|uniref:NAD(P)/FAD-dependent oxidoreductase n=1 Tax=Pseudarthrobacter sp. H2 TaxID=3418415 RepID=UPI003CE8A5D8
MNITVIGGGIIGLCSAYSLSKAGHEVTVIDSGTCGAGASEGNAGWMVPALSQPFNAPGAISDAIMSMLHKDSAIRFQTFPNVDFMKWVALFYRNSSQVNSATARQALVALNDQTIELFDKMLLDVKAEVHDDGLLLPFRTEAGREGFLASHAQIRQAGYAGRAVSITPELLRTMEPDLAPGLVGGVHLIDEKSVRPESITAGLVTWLRSAGARILENCSVRKLEQTPGGWSIETDNGTQQADQVVVAAGAASARILRTTGVKLALEPGRGCSITVADGPVLRHPVKLADVRVACTPFETGTRFSGTFDFAGHSGSSSVGRMKSVLRQASQYFPGLANLQPRAAQVWSGLRPCTPDSVPYIGAVPDRPGLLVATGHGTLGMTLGPVTGDAIAGIVANEPIPPHIRACALDRPQVRLL